MVAQELEFLEMVGSALCFCDDVVQAEVLRHEVGAATVTVAALGTVQGDF